MQLALWVNPENKSQSGMAQKTERILHFVTHEDGLIVRPVAAIFYLKGIIWYTTGNAFVYMQLGEYNRYLNC